MDTEPTSNPPDPPERPGHKDESGGSLPKGAQRETRAQLVDRIFASLPPLGSPEYLVLLKTATGAELPAEVLVRAFRQLKSGPGANATLGRLLGTGVKYGYLDPLYAAARARLTKDEGRTEEDLVFDAIGQIARKLGGPQGANADRAWVRFCRQRLADVHREQIGRHGERRPKTVRAAPSRESDDEIDPMDGPHAHHAPWHGTVEPDLVEWGMAFARQVFEKIQDERIRVVALNYVADEPLQVSSKDPNNTNTLERLLGVDRFQIHRWQNVARALFMAALARQKERVVDIE